MKKKIVLSSSFAYLSKSSILSLTSSYDGLWQYVCLRVKQTGDTLFYRLFSIHNAYSNTRTHVQKQQWRSTYSLLCSYERRRARREKTDSGETSVWCFLYTWLGFILCWRAIKAFFFHLCFFLSSDFYLRKISVFAMHTLTRILGKCIKKI